MVSADHEGLWGKSRIAAGQEAKHIHCIGIGSAERGVPCDELQAGTRYHEGVELEVAINSGLKRFRITTGILEERGVTRLLGSAICDMQQASKCM